MKRPTVMAEFASGAALLEGLRALGAGGVSRLDAFTPYEVDGLQALLRLRRSRLPWIVLAAGLAGGGGAYVLRWWIHVFASPLDVGGRPDHAAPAFMPISFDMAVVIAAASAVVAALVFGGLPRLWDPMFEVEGFERATRDRFWLAVADGDPALDPDRDTAALEAAGALRVVWLAPDRVHRRA